MKILILTQKVDKNDDVLGFSHGWIAEFAKHCEKVTVVALGVGECDLPRNVEIFSLGKENISQKSKVHKVESKLKYIFNFYKYIWQERKSYDTVFVHMNPEYLVLGGILWRLWHKKIGLWYTHKAINFKLYLASKLADIIFTASPESFGLKNKKVKVVGHGIDTNQYNLVQPLANNGFLKILCVGRISPIKNQQLLIEAVDLLVRQYSYENLKVDLVGPVTSEKDIKYRDKLKKIVEDKNIPSLVNFVGSVPNRDIIKKYQEAGLSINLCPTGGMDKVVLESMACGIPVVVLNKTFENTLPARFILKNDNAHELAEKIIEISKESRPQIELRSEIVKRHSLENLIKNIVNSYHV